VNRSQGATTGAWPGYQSFRGWKASGCSGKGSGGPYYLLSYLRSKARQLSSERWNPGNVVMPVRYANRILNDVAYI